MEHVKRIAGLIVAIVLQLGFASTGFASDNLLAGQTLQPNSFLASNNGQFELWMQTDGNLVLYNRTGGGWGVIWQSQTMGYAGLKATLQNDGNLVLTDDYGNPYWQAGTSVTRHATIVVQDDGNLVIYGEQPIWQSATAYGPCSGSVPAAPLNRYGLPPASELLPGQSLRRDQNNIPYSNVSDRLVSANRCYELVMQSDANLVLYRRTDGAYLWQSRTFNPRNGAPNPMALMQSDGNFVVYKDVVPSPYVALWDSHTMNTPGGSVALQDDGNIVIYTRRVPVWAKDQNFNYSPPDNDHWYNSLLNFCIYYNYSAGQWKSCGI